ncbi:MULTISPECIES: hypothetical protein [Sphingobacterium]|uniref:hypothetical protein n=1 Tax=Sphingobacterium TaxID=28453 RepID=UPI0010454625|nr:MULTISPECIES: hypothetical protein [Sphingobacterium]MCW2259860.1 hypothetical protein [Sphingobacterium kitahiroshimense]
MKDTFFFQLYDPSNDLSDHHMENPQTDSALLNVPFFAFYRNKKGKTALLYLKDKFKISSIASL